MRKHLLIGMLAFTLSLDVALADTADKRSAIQPSAVDLATATETASRKAAEWGLDQAEWARFHQLMEGPLGYQSPNLDPLSALGIEAKTEAERTRYAELQVQVETARVTKLLAYQNAYDEAYKRLYPDVLPVNLVASQPDSQFSPTQSDNRPAVFVTSDCRPCDDRVAQLLKQGQRFDLYLVGSQGNDAQLRWWALKAGIKPVQVKDHLVTLNHDDGRWIRIGGQGEFPAVVQQVAGKWVRL